MNYNVIREKFAELTGRYDLIKGDGQDNGADLFLNEGQKMLDRMVTLPHSNASRPSVIVAGGYYVRCQGLRVVKGVWCTDSAGARTRLEKRGMNDLREWYAKEISDIDRGTPAYYAPTAFRPNPDTLLTSSAVSMGVKDYADLMLDNAHYTYSGIILLPPADATYTIRIDGLFYSPELTATKDGSTWTCTKSYWSENQAMTLIQAGMYQLERFYRNTEGMKDAMAGILEVTNSLDADVVEEDSEGVDQMEG